MTDNVGLLTETGRSIDGNWTDYWRKLHSLLMDRVQSIDVNNPADFLHFGGVKMWFLPSSETHGFGDTSFSVVWREENAIFAE